MDFFSAFLLILASNLDTLALGFAYAAKGIHIPLRQQLFIAVMAAAFTIFALTLGQSALQTLPQTAIAFCERHSDKIFGALLILLGVIQMFRG